MIGHGRGASASGGWALVLGLVGAGVVASADEGWVGRSVLLRSSRVTLRVGKQPHAVGPLQQVFRVTQEQGGWLWVRSGRQAGWVRPWQVVGTEHAVDFYTEILSRRPDASWAYLGRGLGWEARGEPRIALKDYDEAVRLAPDDPAARIDRGSLRRERGNVEGALEDLDKAVKLDPNSALAHFARGQALLDRPGRAESALADLDEAIRLQPDLPGAYSARGEIRRGRGDDQAAAADFAEAIRLDPASAAADSPRAAPHPNPNLPELTRPDDRREPHSRLPDRFLVRGREEWRANDSQLDAEIAANEETLRRDPNHYKALNDRGLARFERGDLHGAFDDANRQVQLAPGVVNGYANRAVALRELGDYDRAIADSTEAIRLLPGSGVPYNNRAIARADKKDFDGAMADFAEALRLQPMAASYYGNRAGVFAKMGDYARAVADNTQALAIDPTLAIAYHHLAMIRAACPDASFRDGKQAVAMASQACVRTFWKNHNTLSGYAAALAEDGQFPLAVQWQDRALDLLKGTRYRNDYQERLQLYKAGKPYRMAVSRPKG